MIGGPNDRAVGWEASLRPFVQDPRRGREGGEFLFQIADNLLDNISISDSDKLSSKSLYIRISELKIR